MASVRSAQTTVAIAYAITWPNPRVRAAQTTVAASYAITWPNPKVRAAQRRRWPCFTIRRHRPAVVERAFPCSARSSGRRIQSPNGDCRGRRPPTRENDPFSRSHRLGNQYHHQLPDGDAGGVYGIRTMVNDQKSELATVKDDIQSIRDELTSHVAKEDVVYKIFKRVMNTGISITGALIALLLAIIGYLLVHPVGLQ